MLSAYVQHELEIRHREHSGQPVATRAKKLLYRMLRFRYSTTVECDFR